MYLVLDQPEEYFIYHAGPDTLSSTGLAEIVNADAPRSTSSSRMREDVLATARPAQARHPGLLANGLRLEHRLDRDAGRAAIVGPMERFGDEPEEESRHRRGRLVEAVLDGVGGGRIKTAAAGLAEGEGVGARIEAPYLEPVMQRMWEVERAERSPRAPRRDAGRARGPGEIVEDHLERALEALTPSQRDIAARLFNHLVTPSGTKIAYEASDLAEFAGVSPGEIDAASRPPSPATASCAWTRAVAGRSSTTSSREPCSAGRAAMTPSGRSSVPGRKHDVGTVVLPSSPSSRSSRSRSRQGWRYSPSRSAAKRATRLVPRRVVSSSPAPFRSSMPDPELGLALALEAARA